MITLTEDEWTDLTVNVRLIDERCKDLGEPNRLSRGLSPSPTRELGRLVVELRAKMLAITARSR